MSIQTLDPVAAAPPRCPGDFRFRVRDVTDSLELAVTDVQRGTPVSAVAQTMTSRMELPCEVTYALRDERSGSWLQDDRALDEQIGEDTNVTLRLTPQSQTRLTRRADAGARRARACRPRPPLPLAAASRV